MLEMQTCIAWIILGIDGSGADSVSGLFVVVIAFFFFSIVTIVWIGFDIVIQY